MRILFRVFLKDILSLAFVFIVIAILSTWILSLFFSEYTWALFLSGGFGLSLAGFTSSNLLANNKEWLTPLPISKKKTLLFAFLFQLTTLFIFSLATLFVVFSVLFLKGDLFKVFQQMDQYPKNPTSGIYLKTWMIVTLIQAISIACLRCFPPRFTFILLKERWHQKDRLGRLVFRTATLGVIGLLLVLFKFVNVVLGLFIYWWVIGFWIAYTATVFLKMPRIQVRKVLILVTGLNLMLSAVVYAVAVRTAQSEKAPDRVSAIEALGPFSSWMNPAQVAGVFEAHLNKMQFRELSELYREHFANHGKVIEKQDPYLHFNSLVRARSQGEEEDLLSIADLFAPESLSLENLMVLFEKIEPIPDGEINPDFYLSLIPVPLTESEALVLLRSGKMKAIHYVLLRARYAFQGNENLIRDAIEQDILLFPDPLRYSALTTLSILDGAYRGTDYLFEIKNRAIGHRGDPPSLLFDCRRLHFETAAQLKMISANQIGLLNFCIRSQIDLKKPYLLRRLESLNWISLPIDGPRMHVLQEIFLKKNR